MACKNGYASPRISGEILDCSLPVTFDTYSKCSYNCLYCFSYFQKSINNSLVFKDYQRNELKGVDIDKVKKLFRLEKGWNYLKDHIAQRKYIQWGGLADQFDEYERKEGRTLELLKFFKEINYPISFSSKAVWYLQDERYLSLFRGQKNWHLKISIINLDAGRAKLIEKGVPSPQERLKAMGIWSKLGAGEVTLRLRPFIIGLTDKNGEYLELIKQAKDQGASSVSTEFFCVDKRAKPQLKQRYFEISQVLGFDLLKYYTMLSTGAGYLRLNRKMKLPYVTKMRDLCRELGLRFYVSDSHCKDFSDNSCCCGLADTENYQRNHFAEALIIARKKGRVHFRDLDFKQFEKYYLESHDDRTIGYHFGDCICERREWTNKTVYDLFKIFWNDTKIGKGIYQYFHGALKPGGMDEDGNVFYLYNGEPNAKDSDTK